MKRHPFNAFSLVFGVILILFAAWVASGEWLSGIPQWFLPAGVIVVGAALMSPLFTSRGSNRRRPEESGDGDQPWEASNTPPGESSSLDGPVNGQDGTSSAQVTSEA